MRRRGGGRERCTVGAATRKLAHHSRRDEPTRVESRARSLRAKEEGPWRETQARSVLRRRGLMGLESLDYFAIGSAISRARSGAEALFIDSSYSSSG